MMRALICDAFGHTYGPLKIVAESIHWRLSRKVCTRCLRTTLERHPTRPA